MTALSRPYNLAKAARTLIDVACVSRGMGMGKGGELPSRLASRLRPPFLLPCLCTMPVFPPSCSASHSCSLPSLVPPGLCRRSDLRVPLSCSPLLCSCCCCRRPSHYFCCCCCRHGCRQYHSPAAAVAVVATAAAAVTFVVQLLPSSS